MFCPSLGLWTEERNPCLASTSGEVLLLSSGMQSGGGQKPHL